jgi:hypothetical protein
VEDPSSPPGALSGYVYAGGYATAQQSSTTTGFAFAIAPDGTQTTFFSQQYVKIYGVAASKDAVFLVGEDDSSGSPRAFIDVIPKTGPGGAPHFGKPIAVRGVAAGDDCILMAAAVANGALYTAGCCEVDGHEQAIVCETTFIGDPDGATTTCVEVGPPADSGCSSCATHLHVDATHVDVSGTYSCPGGAHGGFGECIAAELPPPHGPGPQPPLVEVPNVVFNSLAVQRDSAGHRHLILVGTTDSSDLYVGKYTVSPTGITEDWHHTYANADGTITGNDVALDYDGNLYVVGAIDLNLGGTTVRDGYVMRLSNDGSTVEGLQYFGNQSDLQNNSPTEALAIIPYYTDPANTTGSNPDLVVAGWTASSDFDGNLGTTGGQAGFATRVCQDPDSCGALPTPADDLITIS